MSQPSALQTLLDALRCLPGVGPKSAQRMGLHLVERDREGAERLVNALQEALARIGHCRLCRNLTEHALCEICADSRREHSELCIVETPADVLAIERSNHYHGLYHVLMGHLSPLDGIGPAELGMSQLATRLDEGNIKEIILATNLTVEGEVTAHYVSQMAAARGIETSRIAHGVPLGGELDYVDGVTLGHAFAGRRKF